MNQLPSHISERKGPRSAKDLDPEVLEYLNSGKTETKNLVEWLSVDQLALLELVLNNLNRSEWFKTFERATKEQKKPTANSTTRIIGETLGLQTEDKSLYERLRNHTSDVVRCWACWGESLHYDDNGELLEAMKPYAADSHFGVREVVIFATKERLIEDLDKAIDLLSRWTSSKEENIRRYSVETLRPIGVWTKKIAEFQSHSEKGLPLLESLKADESKYVRDSVANWINDIAKSNPDWAKQVCDRWEKESDHKHTAYIIKRGLRSLK
ncbi:MAG: DNA alkylation repair protein [Bacteroidota bacterium]